MIISAQIISATGDFWSVQNCAKLLDVIGDAQTLVEQCPSCSSLVNDGNLKAVAAVNANFGGSTAELMSAMNISFGMAGWLALSLHAIGVEVYVSLRYDVPLCVHLLTVSSFTSLLRNLNGFARFLTSDSWKPDSRILGMRVWSLAILRLRLWLLRQKPRHGDLVHFLANCLRVTRREVSCKRTNRLRCPAFLFQHT
jgi:hypothetical protein